MAFPPRRRVMAVPAQAPLLLLQRNVAALRWLAWTRLALQRAVLAFEVLPEQLPRVIELRWCRCFFDARI